MMGPGPRFELGRKAPQACMLPSYITPATRQNLPVAFFEPFKL